MRAKRWRTLMSIKMHPQAQIPALLRRCQERVVALLRLRAAVLYLLPWLVVRRDRKFLPPVRETTRSP